MAQMLMRERPETVDALTSATELEKTGFPLKATEYGPRLNAPVSNVPKAQEK